MPTDLKIQIFFAVILLMEMLGLFMIVIRTVASLEFAFNRTVAIVDREVQLSRKWREQEKLSREKAVQTESKSKKNELLLNIPFMERLNKEKLGGKT